MNLISEILVCVLVVVAVAGWEELQEEIKCEKLPDLENGQTKMKSRRVGSKATSKCNTHYTLQGNSTRFCLKTGYWSGIDAFCVSAIKCARLSRPSNGQVRPHRRVPGSVAKFRCDRGFVMNGSESVNCTANGSWSHPSPKCEATMTVTPATTRITPEPTSSICDTHSCDPDQMCVSLPSECTSPPCRDVAVCLDLDTAVARQQDPVSDTVSDTVPSSDPPTEESRVTSSAPTTAASGSPRCSAPPLQQGRSCKATTPGTYTCSCDAGYAQGPGSTRVTCSGPGVYNVPLVSCGN